MQLSSSFKDRSCNLLSFHVLKREKQTKIRQRTIKVCDERSFRPGMKKNGDSSLISNSQLTSLPLYNQVRY